MKPLFAFIILTSTLVAYAKSTKMDFWMTTPRGVNIFSQNPQSDFEQASKFGIKLVRIGATGSPGDLRFLNQEDSWNLSKDSFKQLEEAVLKATNSRLKVVLTLAHLPGRSWEYRQRDNRFWRQPQFRVQFIAAWKQIATHFKNNSTIVAYDVFNEPYFPQGEDFSQELQSLYVETVAAIRSVDSTTPIVIESSEMGSAAAFYKLKPIQDPFIIYSFHYYEPFAYFSPVENQGRLSYPGPVEGIMWNKEKHRENLKAVRDWQLKHNIHSYQIYVGEFGVWRNALGVENYLADILQLFQEYGWSWSYYAFREDQWDVTDLELGEGHNFRQETPMSKLLQSYFN